MISSEGWSDSIGPPWVGVEFIVVITAGYRKQNGVVLTALRLVDACISISPETALTHRLRAGVFVSQKDVCGYLGEGYGNRHWETDLPQISSV